MNPGVTTWPVAFEHTGPAESRADVGNLAVGDSHVGHLTGRPRPVDDRPTPNDYVSAHDTIVAALTPSCTPAGW